MLYKILIPAEVWGKTKACMTATLIHLVEREQKIMRGKKLLSDSVATNNSSSRSV